MRWTALTALAITLVLTVGVAACGRGRRETRRHVVVTQPERLAAAAVGSWLVHDAGTAADSVAARAEDPPTTAAAADLTAWHGWARGIPMSALSAAVRPAGANGVVHATLVVSVAVAIGGPKRFDVPVTVSTRRDGDAWKVTDIHAGRREGIRVLTAPTLVVSGVASVLADADHALEAEIVASEAARYMHELDADYSVLHGPTHVFIFISDSDAQTSQMFGERVNPTGDTSGFTFLTGNVDLIAPAFFDQDPYLQAGVVRHELTHVVTESLDHSASTLLLEGLATFQEAPPAAGDAVPMINLTGAERLFEQPRFDFVALLDSRAQRFGTSNQSTIDADYEIAYAVVADIEERYGHAELERVLLRVKNGSTTSSAITTVTGLSVTEFTGAVRGWIAEGMAHQRQAARLF